jgi:hypothetical protein
MTVLASAVIDRVRRQLIDEKTTRRWSDTELLGWVSDAQRAIVAGSPSYGEATSVFALGVGTRQNLPDTTHQLLDIQRNMGVDGDTPGRTVRVVSREVLDTMNPDWHSMTKATVVENYIYDPERPTVFYVYPPNNGTGKIELSLAVTPVELTDINSQIAVSDICQTAIFDYVMFRAHQKDSDYAAGEGKAGVYLSLFMAFMGQLDKGALSESPNAKLAPSDLSSTGSAT